MNLPGAYSNGVAFAVYFHISKLKILRLLKRCRELGKTADLGSHPGYQLPGAERFGDIIVGPQAQTQDFIHIALPGAQHENGNG